MDSDDEDWYEDYLNRCHQRSTTPAEAEDSPILPSGYVIDAKNTTGAVSAHQAAATNTSKSTPTTATSSSATRTERTISGGTDPVQSSLDTTAEAGTTTTRIRSSAKHHEASPGQVLGAIAAGPTRLSAVESTSNVDIWSTPGSSRTRGRGGLFWYTSRTFTTTQPRTIEAFAVPPDPIPNPPYPALRSSDTIVTAYPMEPTSAEIAPRNSQRRNGLVWALASILIVVAVSMVGGYCFSGACNRRSDRPVDGSLKDSPATTISPVSVPATSQVSVPNISPVSTPAKSPTKTEAPSTASPFAHDTTVEPTRAKDITAYINNITLSGRRIVFNQTNQTENETVTNALSPEEMALRWLIEDDPLFLWPNVTLHRARLRQRYALLALWFQQQRRNATMSEAEVAWYRTTAWLREDDECKWKGVTCNETSRGFDDNNDASTGQSRNVVTQIQLDSNNVHGSMPADLGLLTSLVRIDVFNNSMTGSLPPSIGLWVNMEFFRISNNTFTGTVPQDVRNWDNIYFASFHSNLFSGTMPNGLCHQSNLTYLIADCASDESNNFCPCCHVCYNESNC